jgi:enterochelin esterase-like enzyme
MFAQRRTPPAFGILMLIGLLGALLLAACTLSASTPVASTAVSTASPSLTPSAPNAATPAASAGGATTVSPTITPSVPAEPIVIDTLQDLRAIVRRIATAAPVPAQAQADALWQTLVSSQRVPLTLGDQVVFFYKGEARQVNWRGVFNGWGAPGLEGGRIGQTDLWIGQLALPAASRIEYKIVLDDQDWLVDPANPNTTFSGLTGVNNVVVMSGFTVTDNSQKRSDVAPGTLTGGLSMTSQYLGYIVNYWVYTPAGYENLKELPVLYVLDGNDFVDDRMGALPNILDNLIASGRIQPMLAVFVDAREPDDPQHNRREDEFLVHPVEHARFIADELVPAVDRTYRTDPRPDARAIMGVSYGGLSATFIAASQSRVFHNLAALSPSLWVLDSPQYLADPQQVKGSRPMLAPMQAATACGDDTRIKCPSLPIKVFLTAGIPSWDVGDFTSLVATLERQGYPVEFHQVREGHAWSAWRGLSDEMLLYFFGAR